MASKVQVAKFPAYTNDFNDVPRLGPISHGHRNMEENEVLDRLNDDSSKKRVEILEQLIITVKRNGGQLPYPEPLAIYKGLGQALSDSNWEIRLKCIQLLNEVIPHAKEELDHYMKPVIQRLIPNIGDKVTVKRAVIQTLHVYMKHTYDVPALLRAIVRIGLENDDSKIRKEMISALPMILTKEFAHDNFYEMIQSLAKKLLDSSVEDNLQDSSLFALGKIELLVGEREFSNYLQKLSAPLRNYYLKLSGKQPNGFNDTPTVTPRAGPTPMQTVRRSVQGYPEPEYKQEIPYQGMPFTNMNGSQSERRAEYMDSRKFGIIPSHVMNHINDQENFRTRAQAVEELKLIVSELEDYEIGEVLMPEMAPFINFLSQLLDDSNFKITSVTLEILYIIVEKLGRNVKHFLKPIASALSKRMCDNKVVARQAVMKVAIKMMQTYSPKPVLLMFAENLKHKNSRVRQETINVIIAALLTFPSYDFDLPSICKVVGPTLTDGKRQVRQGALECFSVLAQAMGSGRLQPLVQAVDQVELTTEGEGLMAAVQARLARRQLPRLNTDGLVEYATPIPSSASHRTPPNMAQGADMEWILSVSGTGSARSSRSDPHMELESVTGSARSTPSVPDTPTPAPRRFMSAGRGRNKFPWEEEKDERKVYEGLPGSAPSQGYVSDDPTPKPRNMWMNDNEVGQDQRRVPKRRSTVMGINATDESTDNGSYMQIYKRKQQLNVTRINNYAMPDPVETTIKDIKENGFHRPEHKSTPRPFLDPISADQGSVSGSDRTDEDESIIFHRPTIARGSASRRKSPKVPPISTSTSTSYSNIRDDDSDSAYAASLEDGQPDEMQTSLRKIRNSASKKKAERLEKQSSRQSLNSSPPFSDNNEESGIFSNVSQKEEENRKRGKKVEAPFEPKPKLVHSNSLRKKNSEVFEIEGSSSNISQNYNPSSGVTFQKNRNSDVQVVGRGYNDDSSSVDSRPSMTGSNKAARDRRRLTKGSSLSPLGMASLHSIGAVDIDDDKTPSQENIALIGKGMFDQPPATTEYPVSGVQSRDKFDRRILGSDTKPVPNGVVGVGVKQNGEDLGFVDEDMDEDLNASMTKTLREKVAAKQLQQKEEVEQKKMEKEKKRQEQERKEKERQQEKLRRLSSSESLGLDALSISGSGSTSTTNLSTLSSPTKTSPPKVAQPAITPRKKIKTVSEPVSSQPMSVTQSPTTETENIEDTKPFPNPDAAVREALRKMAQDEWATKMEAVTLVRRLSFHHPDVLSSQLHTVILAIIVEVKNLRSQVSRLAIVCLGEMYTNLKKIMDQDLDKTVQALLAKSAESNNFIRADVERALGCMIDNVTTTRALVAIVTGGATHKNIAVRRATAQCLVDVVEKMGPGRVLSGVKDITDRVLPTAAQFALDGSQETRYLGKKILHQLMSHQDFDKMLTKYLPANTSRNVQDVVDNLRNKGLGDVPSETSSARSRRSGQGSRTGSSVRGGSASSSAESVNTPVPKRRSVRTDEGTMQDIQEMTNQLSANDWKTRHAGITQVQNMCETNLSAVSANLVKIFDKFLPRLQDSNSKVNLFALQTMLRVIPLLKDHLLSGVLNMTVANVAPNLSSKNKDIYTAATDILNCFIEYMDPSLLVQPFANQAQVVSPRSKPDMVLKVAYLVDRVYSKKQKQVILHVLPLLWHLLGAQNSSGALHGGSSDLRQAVSSLVAVLYRHMGQSLIEKASSDPNVSTRHLNLLQELIDQS